MFEPKKLDEIAHRISNALPSGVTDIKDDIEKNLHALVQSALSKLDMVSREEFEVQKAVLAKTRSRLEALEKQVEALEKQLNSN